MPLVVLPVPHIQQHGIGDCLATCSLMVLTYLRHNVSYQQLFSLLQTDWYGTAFSNISNLEKLGVTVVHEQGTLTKLYDHLKQNRPCIVAVNTNELPYWDETTPHAIVVVGMDENWIYLNDPVFATAPMQVSHGDFDLAWFEQDEFYATFITT